PAFAQIRTCPGLPLYAGALGRVGALLRRWPPGARQQSRRARSTLRRHWPQELPVCRLPCRRSPRRRDLFADRKRQAQRHQSAALPRRRARPHRRPPGPPHRHSCPGTGNRSTPPALPPKRAFWPSAYGEHGIAAVTVVSFEVIAIHSMLGLHVANDRLDRSAATHLAANRGGDLAADPDAELLGVVVAVIAFVDVDATGLNPRLALPARRP